MSLLSRVKSRLHRRKLVKLGRDQLRRCAYSEALKSFREVLEFDTEMYGPEDATVAEDYDNLGILSRRTGELDAAVEYYKKAIAILEVVAVAHNKLSFIHNHLGIVYKDLEYYDLAVECHEKALSLQRKQAGAGGAIGTTEVLLTSARAARDR